MLRPTNKENLNWWSSGSHDGDCEDGLSFASIIRAIAPMTEAASNSEKSVNFYQTDTQQLRRQSSSVFNFSHRYFFLNYSDFSTRAENV
jgi:hypothetical protein